MNVPKSFKVLLTAVAAGLVVATAAYHISLWVTAPDGLPVTDIMASRTGSVIAGLATFVFISLVVWEDV